MNLHTDIESLNVEDCLRPAFAKTLLHELLNRRNSINLTGDTGQGKSRMLEDLKHMEDRLGIRIALVNLKDFRRDYEGFLRDMAMQLGLPNIHFQRFEGLLDAIHTQVQVTCLIMVDNLEVLNEYPSNHQRYDDHFVSSLNNLKNKNHIRLACASRVWLKKVVFQHETSLLELHQLEMPDLHDKEIEAEIRRRCPALTTAHRAELRKSIRDCTQTTKRLDFLLRKAVVHYEAKKFPVQLKTWLAAYETENG